MYDNENLVTDVTENVETTATEEIVGEQVDEKPVEKTFTQTELNEIVKGAKARAKAQARKEYERKYGDLTTVLKAGTGKESVEELTDTFAKFYKGKGIKIPREPDYSAKDTEILATAEANEVIKYGYDEVVEEVDRLTELGVDNMTAKEKAMFKVLAEYRQKTERQNELAKIGVTEEVFNSKEFQEFASDYKPGTPIEKIWNNFRKMQPQKEIKPMGSMKNTVVNEVKDFYSPEEISRLSEDDLRNPDVWNAVRRSMTGTK